MSNLSHKKPTNYNEKVSLIHPESSSRVYPEKLVNTDPTSFDIRVKTVDITEKNFPLSENDRYILIVGTREHWLVLEKSMLHGPFYGLEFSV